MTDTIVSEDQLYRKAIDQYGVNAQLDQCIEEYAEKIQAIAKWKGHGFQKRHLPNLYTEIADCTIMDRQLLRILQDMLNPEIDVLTLIDAEMDFKLTRLQTRLTEAGVIFDAEPPVAELSTH